MSELFGDLADRSRRCSRPRRPRADAAGGQHHRNQRGVPGRGDLHRSIFVGALRTGAQGRRHQGARAEESDGQAEGQDGDRHPDLYQACRREFCVEGPEGGGQSRHGDDGLRDRRHGPELQAETLLYAPRGGTGRTAARHHQRVPRRLPSIDRNRPEGRNRSDPTTAAVSVAAMAAGLRPIS